MIKDIFNPSSTCFEDKDLEKALKIYFAAPSMAHEGNEPFYPLRDYDGPEDKDGEPSPWDDESESDDEHEAIKAIVNEAKIKEYANFIRRSPLYKSMVKLYEASDPSQNRPIAEFIQENPVEVGKIMSQAACDRASNWVKSNILDWGVGIPCPDCLFLILKSDKEIAEMEPAEKQSYLVHVLKEIALVKLIRNLAYRRERLIQTLDNYEEIGTEAIKDIVEVVKTCFYELQETENQQSEENDKLDKENNADEIKTMANFTVEYDRLFSQEYMMRNYWACTANILQLLLDLHKDEFHTIESGGRMDWKEASLELTDEDNYPWPDHLDIGKLKDIQSVFAVSKKEAELEQTYLKNMRRNAK